MHSYGEQIFLFYNEIHIRATNNYIFLFIIIFYKRALFF